MLDYCPELKHNKWPKDRTFFFNVLNTIEAKCVDRMVINAMKQRQNKTKIENEI